MNLTPDILRAVLSAFISTFLPVLLPALISWMTARFTARQETKRTTIEWEKRLEQTQLEWSKRLEQTELEWAKKMHEKQNDWKKEDTRSFDDAFSQMAATVSQYNVERTAESRSEATKAVNSMRTYANGYLGNNLDDLYNAVFQEKNPEEINRLLSIAIEEKRSEST